MLAWIAGSVAVAALLARPLRWPRLDSTAVVLLPALALSLAHDVAHGRTSVTEYGWAVYSLAWALHFALLYRSEARAAAEPAATGAKETAVLDPRRIVGHRRMGRFGRARIGLFGAGLAQSRRSAPAVLPSTG